MTKGKTRNIVDRLVGVELGALAAELVENVDDMRLHVQEAQFENGEQAARPCANDQHIGFYRFAHVSFFSLNLVGRPQTVKPTRGG